MREILIFNEEGSESQKIKLGMILDPDEWVSTYDLKERAELLTGGRVHHATSINIVHQLHQYGEVKVETQEKEFQVEGKTRRLAITGWRFLPREAE